MAKLLGDIELVCVVRIGASSSQQLRKQQRLRRKFVLGQRDRKNG